MSNGTGVPSPDHTETVTPGHGVPCSPCVISHVSAGLPPAPVSAPVTESPTRWSRQRHQPRVHRAWGWPVTLRRNQIWLTLQT